MFITHRSDSIRHLAQPQAANISGTLEATWSRSSRVFTGPYVHLLYNLNGISEQPPLNLGSALCGRL